MSSSNSSSSLSSLLPPPIRSTSGTASTTSIPKTRPPPPRAINSTPALLRAAPSLSRRPTIVQVPPTPPTLDSTELYRPPPPPSRAIAPNERLAPLRPTLPPGTSGGEDSSEEEEDEAWTKSQEFPDATFANRRPPSLRHRRSVHASSAGSGGGVFTAFAVRGRKVVHAGQHHAYIWHPTQDVGHPMSVALPTAEQKVTAMEFKVGGEDDPLSEDGRYLWGGTKEGNLFEIDTEEGRISGVKPTQHSHPIVAIHRMGRAMVTLDESGKALVWGEVDGPKAPNLNTSPVVFRVGEKLTFNVMIGRELWTAIGPNTKLATSSTLGRSPQVRIYDPDGSSPTFLLTPSAVTTPESAGFVGSVTAGAVVPHQPHLVYLAHDNGCISIWDRATHTCLRVQRVSPYGITAMVGVGRGLWAGFRTGFISVFDVVEEPWTVVKAWKAHKEAVTRIVVDPASLWMDETLQIASSGADMMIHLWDGLLRDDWIDTELHLRRREFCTFRDIRVLCVSWNVDASKPQELVGPVQNYEFLQECLTSVESPDIISFGFQEMIDLENKKLTAKTMLLGKKRAEQKFTDGVSSSYRLWHDKLVQAVRLAMPPETPYTVVHVGDMVGLFSCIFVKNAERVGLKDIALTTVKTGLKGRYGNKGAILSRFVLDDSSLCFINCHLAAGQSHRQQRDRDLVNILEDKSGFSELGTSSPGAYAAGGEGTNVFDHELCILSGDLNYRIDMRRDAVAKAVADNALHTLLPQDQLLKGMASNQSFRLRSFKEAPITFAPTYKYDPGTDDYDSSPKRRIPAWCDRVLWRADKAAKVTPVHYRRYECNISDHKPISAAIDAEIKSILPDKRAIVFKEVESAWFEVESDRLARAREYYAAL